MEQKTEKLEAVKDELEQKEELNRKLSAAILVSIDIKSNFELYAYRVIHPEQFIQRIEDLLKIYKKAT